MTRPVNGPAGGASGGTAGGTAGGAGEIVSALAAALTAAMARPGPTVIEGQAGRTAVPGLARVGSDQPCC